MTAVDGSHRPAWLARASWSRQSAASRRCLGRAATPGRARCLAPHIEWPRARGEMPLGIESAVLDRHGFVLLGACSAAARVSTGDPAVGEVRQFEPTAASPPRRLHAAAGAPVLRKARPATRPQALPCRRARMPIEMNSAMGTEQAATFVGGLGRMKISLLPGGTRTLDPKWKLRSRKADQAAIRYGMPSVQ
jgi:hypothetical protein